MFSPPALESQATSSQGSPVASLSEEDPRKSKKKKKRDVNHTVLGL